MYSGFVTRKRVVKSLGVHQRFDVAAYRMIESYISPGTFPALKQILHFEGINGPDGLKIKSPGDTEGTHIYDPHQGDGDVPRRVLSHYAALADNLQKGDMVRSAFEAGWLAHYITDGLTPAHHYPLDKRKAELFGQDSEHGFFKKNWAWWGRKGVISTHVNFEMGVAAALLLFPIRTRLDDDKLAHARRIGPIAFFKEEALEIAELDIYKRFYRQGWTAELARTIREVIAPQAAQAIGIIWLLAYLEAGLQSAKAPRSETIGG